MINRKNPGFTLAEVLITLAIIGVIASMTIPGLIQSQNKSQYVVGLKKAMSTFQQAANMYMTENGCIGNIDCEGIFALGETSAFYNAMKPYLNIAKDCGEATDQDCWPDDTKLLNGDILSAPTNGDFDSVLNMPRAVLADGTSIIIENSWGIDSCNQSMGSGELAKICGHISVDVNGKKGPNQVGKDSFRLVITHLGRIVPAGTSR